jgi:hypothetical protein
METGDNQVHNSAVAEDGVGMPFGPCLPASTFKIPSEVDTELELWSIRVPVDCDITEVFHGKKLTMRGLGSTASTSQNIVCTLSDVDGDIAHALIQDEGVDFQSHRVLSKVVDEDDGIMDESESMRPLYKFDRSFHFLQDSSIVQDLFVLNQHQVDTKLAPNAMAAPAPEAVINIEIPSKEMRRGSKGTSSSKALPQQVHSFRAAYGPVPQKTNLKRRWKPSGSCSAAVYVPQEHLSIKCELPHTSQDEQVGQIEKLENNHELDKKEKKRLKKMSKQLKKEKKSKREKKTIDI